MPPMTPRKPCCSKCYQPLADDVIEPIITRARWAALAVLAGTVLLILAGAFVAVNMKHILHP